MPDLKEAGRVTNLCVELYLDMGKLVRAAKELNHIADAYRTKFNREKDEQHATIAVDIYKRCHDYYRRDGHWRVTLTSTANVVRAICNHPNCIVTLNRKARAAASRVHIEMGNLMVLPGRNLFEGGKVFEVEAHFAANEKLLKYSAKCKLTFEWLMWPSLWPSPN